MTQYTLAKKEYVDERYANAVSESASYTDGVANTTLTNSINYTDSQIANTTTYIDSLQPASGQDVNGIWKVQQDGDIFMSHIMTLTFASNTSCEGTWTYPNTGFDFVSSPNLMVSLNSLLAANTTESELSPTRIISSSNTSADVFQGLISGGTHFEGTDTVEVTVSAHGRWK